MKYKCKNIFKLAEQIQSLQQEAIKQTLAFYEQEIESIFQNKICNKQRIEQALDRLLDVAFDERVLKLYKRLCRHYYFIDPRASIFYVNYYREIWDQDSLVKDKNNNSELAEGMEGLGYGE